MLVSEARREANRRNAARSTGPRTEAGKAASRRNALKHGLTGSTVDLGEPPTDPIPVGDPTAGADGSAWTWRGWLVGELAGTTRRLDRLHREEEKLRNLIAFRALTAWDDDRALVVADLGAKLGRDPARVARQLRSTPHGCDWLIERWAALAHQADRGEAGVGEGWTEEQRRLAFDLLGTPLDVRPDRVGILLDAEGRPVGPPRTDAEVARAELADLHQRRDEVAEADEVDRTLAEDGMNFDASADLRRLRRYEAALNRRLHWCVAQLDGPESTPPPHPRSGRPADASPEAPPRPASPPPAPPRHNPAPAPAPAATFDSPPVSSSTDLPDRPRVAARLRQAEARRANKQRKLDRRRA